MTLGPVFIDLSGTSINTNDRRKLAHPSVGGVVLFSRNFSNKYQLKQLVADIQRVRTPALLVAVDHEGGRVQRFRPGFTPLPSARSLGLLFDTQPALAGQAAYATGYLAGVELSEVGIELVFAPVIDLFRQDGSTAIGDRAFHENPEVVVTLASSFIRGIRDGGATAIAKHFPGHGSVQLDSHIELPEDCRDLGAVMGTDLRPFVHLASDPHCGWMTGHLYYPAVDKFPVTFSEIWLRGVLRQQLGFNGYLFSDDLTMSAALTCYPSLTARVEHALAAGCDSVLVLNGQFEASFPLSRESSSTEDRYACLRPSAGDGAFCDEAKRIIADIELVQS